MELRLMFGVNMIPGVIWVLGMFLCMIKEWSHSFIGGGSPKTRVSKENEPYWIILKLIISSQVSEQKILM
jgi:hypothetical protein